jgi:Arc/MetJ-type ribon-helix-helix transcriptional regulator
MKTVEIELGKELTKGVRRAVKEFNYGSVKEFVLDSIRHRLRESKLERDKNKLWRSLLSDRNDTHPRKMRFEYRPRFGLKHHPRYE